MSEEKDDIGKILSDFKTQKEQRETPVTQFFQFNLLNYQADIVMN